MSYQESQKRVRQIHAALEKGETLSDDEILKRVGELAIVTNTLSAAYLLVGFIAPICAYRPHLTETLLPNILHPLWMTGFRTEKVIKWLQYHLTQADPFDGMQSPGIDWVRGLLEQKELITELLNQIQEEENLIGTARMRKALANRSSLPLSRINFRSYWDRRMVVDNPAIVLYFYFDEGSETVFDLLARALAEIDLKAEIQFYAFEGAFSDQGPNDHFWEIPTANEPATQCVWIIREHTIHSTLEDVTDYEIYRQNTLDLLQRLNQ